MRAPPSRTARAAAVAVALAIFAWALWLYWMPRDYACAWGINPERAEHFREVLRLPGWRASTHAFRVGLVVCAAAAWTAYLTLLSAGLAGGALPRERTRRLAAVLLAVLAIVAPPALSSDVYAYVGYARLVVVHHLNPYVETQTTLMRLGDLTARFLFWPISSPYGPLWTWVSIVIVRLLPTSVIWPPIVAFKLLGAASILALAEGGRRLAERLSLGRGELVFAAIALNPLFVIEGVASAHNDLFMMALVMWALVLAAEGRARPSFVLLGLAASIKFVPLLLAPWLLFAALQRERWRRWPVLALQAIGLTLLPLVVTFTPFWHGLSTLAGLEARSTQGLHPAGDGPAREGAVVLAIFALLTPFVVRGPPPRALRGWVAVSLSVIVFTTGMWFPWYFIWPWAIALVLLDGLDVLSAGLLLGGALLSQWSYVR